MDWYLKQNYRGLWCQLLVLPMYIIYIPQVFRRSPGSLLCLVPVSSASLGQIMTWSCVVDRITAVCRLPELTGAYRLWIGVCALPVDRRIIAPFLIEDENCAMREA